MSKAVKDYTRQILESFDNYAELHNCLDEWVSDTMSEKASKINNSGIEIQIEFLLKNGHRPQHLIESFKNMIGEKNV